MGGLGLALARYITRFESELTHQRELVTYDYLRHHPELLEDQSNFFISFCRFSFEFFDFCSRAKKGRRYHCSLESLSLNSCKLL